ncbi:uncharacterized protein C1orf226 homolog [Pteropus medius]|uniref:uncharacterized protein C1orf226 homolog n=1 Tax=Pteropus vampyrus TaxID=132908 RepID=UPI00196A9EBB|nr:uncharacterized protein C1orf226 homolog [Pteropus giganteus]
MFENVNAALTPQPQSGRPFPRSSWSPAPSSAALGSAEHGGPGLWGGGSQHLEDLGQAVGTRASDLLQCREPWSGASAGTVEVNAAAEAQLASGGGGRPWEAFPRLEPPPPPAARKRTPRALKTTRDMLISSQPVLSSLDCGAELVPGQPQDAPPVPAEVTMDVVHGGGALPNGQPSLSVPDLIHQDSQDEARLKATEGGRAPSPGPVQRNSRSLSPSPTSPAERPEDSGLDSEGPHPDLLSFE